MTYDKCSVWLVAANEQPELILNEKMFRRQDDDNQRLLEAMHRVGSFMCHYQHRYCYLPQDKQHSVGGVKHTKQLSLIEAENQTIK